MSQSAEVQVSLSKRSFKWISPGALVFAMLCFLMPFFEIQCASNGSTLMSVKGYELVTGTDMDLGEAAGQTDRDRMPASPLAIGALALALLGILAFFFGKKARFIGGAITAGLGFLAMLILFISVQQGMKKEGEGMIKAAFQFGFWLSLLSFFLACITNIWMQILHRNSVVESVYEQPEPMKDILDDASVESDQEV